MSRTRATTSVLVASCMWVLPLGCGDDHGGDHHDDHGDHHDDHHDDHHGDAGHSHAPVGPPSGADCPSSGTTLTYENFGKKFMADYCLSCHSSKVSGNARMGAPADHNFDTLDEIDLVADHIDQYAAFGPDNKNQKMPPTGNKPTDDEREKLGEWIACGLPE